MLTQPGFFEPHGSFNVTFKWDGGSLTMQANGCKANDAIRQARRPLAFSGRLYWTDKQVAAALAATDVHAERLTPVWYVQQQEKARHA